MKAKVALDKKGHGNTFNVSFNITKGELLALKNALETYAGYGTSYPTGNPIAYDVLCYLNNALTNGNVSF